MFGKAFDFRPGLHRQADFSWTRETLIGCKIDGIESLEIHGVTHLLREMDAVGDILSLRALSLSSSFQVDVANLSRLSRLESLNLSAPICGEIDFSWFPELRNLFIRWPRRATHIDSLAKLNQFSSTGITQDAAAIVVTNNQLHGLRLISGKITSLDFVYSQKALRTLRLALCRRVMDWGPIATMLGLESVRFEQCGSFNDLDFTEPLSNLKYLLVDSQVGHSRWEDYLYANHIKWLSVPKYRSEKSLPNLSAVFPDATFVKLGKTVMNNAPFGWRATNER